MTLLDKPDQYFQDKISSLGDDDQVFVKQIKELIAQSIVELGRVPIKEKSKCAEALEKLIKIYLLLSGRATDRKEIVEKRRLTLEAIIKQTKEEKGEEFLEVMDYQILEELEGPKDES